MIINAIYAAVPVLGTLGLIALHEWRFNRSMSDEEAARLAGELDSLLAFDPQH